MRRLGFIAMALFIAAAQAHTVGPDRPSVEKRISELGDALVRTSDKSTHENMCLLAYDDLDEVVKKQVIRELKISLPDPSVLNEPPSTFKLYCAYYLLNFYQKGEKPRAHYEGWLDQFLDVMVEREKEMTR